MLFLYRRNTLGKYRDSAFREDWGKMHFKGYLG
jgi:hypothetical protein